MIDVEGLSLLQLDQLVRRLARGWRCFCGASLEELGLHFYTHPGGYKLAGHSNPVWVYYHCPRCGYDWALAKILRSMRKPEVVA